MAQITEAKLFEWMGRLYAERQAVVEERDEARLAAKQLADQFQADNAPAEVPAAAPPKRRGKGK